MLRLKWGKPRNSAFYQGLVARYFIHAPPIYLYLLPLLAFLGYWILPLILLAISNYSLGSMSYRGITLPHGISLYLDDRTHLIFSIIMSFGTFPVLYILRATAGSFRHAGYSFECPAAERNRIFAQYQKLALNRVVIALSFLLSIAILYTFLQRVWDPAYASWWGNHKYGFTGVFFSILVSQMTFWGTRSLFLIGIITLMIIRFSRHSFKYVVISADGCNNLKPLGFLIIMIWMFCLLVGLSIYIVFKNGYLGIEQDPATWLVAIVSSIAIPIIAILPLAYVTRAVDKARNATLLQARRRYASRTGTQDPELTTINEFLSFRRAVLGTSILPFRMRVVIALALANLLQALASLHELTGS